MTNQNVVNQSAKNCAALMCSVVLWMASPDVLAQVDVTIKGTIMAPPACVINGGNTLNVPFGNSLMTTRVDGVEYRRGVPYTVTCTGGASNAMTLTLRGTGAAFDTQSLVTNKADLGVKLFIDGAPWPLNTSVKFTYPNLPMMEAVPVKRPTSTLVAGTFSAAATLVVAQQ